METDFKRNKWTFGLGTIGRDMVYSLISMYLVFYLTDILSLSNKAMWWVTAIMLSARVFDALNDPIMGVIVDNTKSKYGKFKPWILIGALGSGVLTISIFFDYKVSESAFIPIFAVLYLLWGILFTANDISYWSMMPSLTTDAHEREAIGSIARICANIGLFAVVVGIIPITEALSGTGSGGFFVFAIGVVVIMWVGQLITLLGVKQPRLVLKTPEPTTLSGMVKVIFKNDQLLVTAISMALFMIGYVTTTSFGLYFFKYAYGDEAMYSIFALILGVSQIAALAIFPKVAKKFVRAKIYKNATIVVVIGYVIFFFAPMNMLYIGIAGILLFVGQAFIQILMLMFLADTIEYGHYKLGKRNESVTFSIQPFINKMGGAVASGVVGATVILSGINDAKTASDVTSQGLLMLKIAMLIFPLICIILGYILYSKRYIIDKSLYEDIIKALKDKGEIA
ncbi:MAG: sugar transporter [Clostridiales bacterium 38-18]|nr:MAG: sugar transporter [Clostridiales bacterium 38-18]